MTGTVRSQLVTIGSLHEMEATELTQALGEIELLRVQILARLNPARTVAVSAPVERLSEWKLTAKDVLTRLNVSRSWLYRSNHRLPFAKQLGRSWRYSEKGLERYMSQREVA
jgi:predicted DNA-binding transcriptional regulator AlpA